MPDLVNTDVVIVGAGIAGAGLAAALGDRRRVVLVEREEHAGAHATGRSAAVFVPNYGDGLVRLLTAASATALQQPDPEIWSHPVLKPRGLLRLVAADGKASYARQMQGAGGVEEISPTDARELFPLINPQRFVAASYERDVFDIDVDALLQGYLRSARRRGVKTLFGQEVTGITRTADGWRVETPGERLEAPVIVNAAGAWADKLAAHAGVRQRGLRALRRSMAIIDLPEDSSTSETWPFVVRFPLNWYAKPDAGRLIVSPGDEDQTKAHDAHADDMVIAEGLHHFEQDVTIKVQRLRRTWAGLRTFSADGHPVVGFDGTAEGFFWLAGQGGFGVQTAPALSELAAGLICGEDAASWVPPDLVDRLAPERYQTCS